MKRLADGLGLLVGVLLVSVSPVRAEQGSFARSASEIRVSLKRALKAIERLYGERYDGEGFLKRLDALDPNDQAGHEALQREALLANMTLDFKNLLIIDRKHAKKGLEPFEPLPIKQRPAPPIIPSRVKPESDVATLYIQDIYEGPGLKGVPRGTVKQLRIGSYQFSANGNGGHQGTIGTDSGWDIKTIVGGHARSRRWVGERSDSRKAAALFSSA